MASASYLIRCARRGIRTPTPYGIRPSSVRVCQFHHPGFVRRSFSAGGQYYPKIKINSISIQEREELELQDHSWPDQGIMSRTHPDW